MTIHVTISEAEKRLGELVDAAGRGEVVVIETPDGSTVQIVVPEGDHALASSVLTPEQREARRAQRLAAFGMLAEEFKGFDLSLAALKADRDPDRR